MILQGSEGKKNIAVNRVRLHSFSPSIKKKPWKLTGDCYMFYVMEVFHIGSVHHISTIRVDWIIDKLNNSKVHGLEFGAKENGVTL